MSEVKFILKCLAVTIVLLLAMQMHWGEESLETRFEHWVKTSKVTQFLKKSSEGGGLFIARTYHSVQNTITRQTASTEPPQKAEESIETDHDKNND